MKLLIEYGVEELPAIPFLKERENILPKWEAALAAYGIDAKGAFKFEYTPRRLVLFGETPEFAPDVEIESIGAPRAVAMKDGAWTKAAESFAAKCGVSVDALEFKEVKGKEVLYHKSVQKGRAAKQIVPEAAKAFLQSLNFGRSMRWGSGEYEFIRPLRSLVVMLDDADLGVEIFGVKSEKATFPHRDFGYEKIKFETADEYFDLLKTHGVMLSADERRAKIMREFAAIEAKSGLKIEMDEALMDEVVAITEFPSALLGGFEESFLEVPSEVIITSMKENQRYFPVRFADAKLANHFVVVANSTGDGSALIVRGNEKVLRARLSDAKFFWESDLASEFSAVKLKNITYLAGLGSMYDKEIRERAVAGALAALYDHELKMECGEGYLPELERAVMLSKADLTTQMVYEFTDLQGVMGAYYAAARNERPEVCEAIREQYLPGGEDSACPSSLFSSVVALSTKLDALMGLFSIGKIPSGTKDPYALRRAASGVLKIALNRGLNFDVRAILEKIASNYAKFDLDALASFIFDRLYTMYNANPSVIKACLNSGESDVKALDAAIRALDEISRAESFKEDFATFKRLANIIKDSQIGAVDESLFEDDSERALNAAFASLALDKSDAKGYLESLFGLRPQIDEFFERVMINHENPRIKANRIALVGQIYKAFLRVADVKEISA